MDSTTSLLDDVNRILLCIRIYLGGVWVLCELIQVVLLDGEHRHIFYFSSESIRFVLAHLGWHVASQG